MPNPSTLVALLWSISSGGLQADLDKVKIELNANYAAMARAFLHKDIKGISKFLDVNFSTKSLYGIERNFDKYLEDVEKQMETYRDLSWYRKAAKVVKTGGDFLATVEGHMKATGPGADGKPHQLDISSIVMDTWTRSGRRWLLVSSIVKQRSVFVDGKPHQGPLMMQVTPPFVWRSSEPADSVWVTPRSTVRSAGPAPTK